MAALKWRLSEAFRSFSLQTARVWVRSFCQCSGLCACMAALCCAVAASIFIYVAGDGAGNGPAPAAVAYKCTSDLYFGRVLKPEQKDDDRDWRLVKQLVQVLGRQHVMGIAVGNELELLQFKENVSTECIQRMWKGGYFLRKLSERAADLDHLEAWIQS
eukprot:g9477.t1